jgi:hypothetical protein
MVNHARHLDYCMISVNRLKNRKSDFQARNWIMDSAAFTRITTHGEHFPIEWYADQVDRWSSCGKLDAAVSQDYMCESFVLEKTGKTVEEHQSLTIERYIKLRRRIKTSYLMPVLQGFTAQEYVNHIRHYGVLLKHCAWVGVGSICKRNSSISSIQIILGAIKKERPDLCLHGFGLKTTALSDGFVRRCLSTSDSMAWSFAVRKRGGNSSSLVEAQRFGASIQHLPYQESMWKL